MNCLQAMAVGSDWRGGECGKEVEEGGESAESTKWGEKAGDGELRGRAVQC